MKKQIRAIMAFDVAPSIVLTSPMRATSLKTVVSESRYNVMKVRNRHLKQSHLSLKAVRICC